MKLRTSFFNPTVFRKNMTRFFPVWGLATIFLSVAMLSTLTDGTNSEAMFFMETTTAMSIVGFIYAIICAMVLLGDLYSSRLCNALHTLPLRRECWFWTHIISGILFALIPCSVATLAALLLLKKYTFIAALWFLVVMGQFLFHFGLAMLCGMCVGNRFAHGVLYCIAAFLSMIVYGVLVTFYQPLLYGVQFGDEIPRLLCPTITMGEEYTVWIYSGYRWVYQHLEFTSWIYLGICVAVGIGLLFAAMAVYKRRKLESAGDFLAVNVLRPVFLLLYILMAGIVFYWIGDVFIIGGQYVLMFLGMAVGYFTGKMLLSRTVRVFSGKSVLAGAAVLLAIGASLALTWLDPVGVSRWVPENVSSVSVWTSSNYSNPSLEMTEPEDIALVQAIHENLVEDHTGNEVTVNLHYTLPSGLTVRRVYTTNVEALQTIQPRFSSWEYVMNEFSYEYLLPNVHLVEISKAESFPMEALKPLLDAIRMDCAAGNMVQDQHFHQSHIYEWINFQFYTDDGSRGWLHLEIYEEAVHTLEVLETYVPEIFAEGIYVE